PALRRRTRERERSRARSPTSRRPPDAVCALPPPSPASELFAGFLDEAHAQVVEDLFEQAGFGGIEIAASLLLEQADDVDELTHGGEIRLGLPRERMGDLAEAHERLRAEAHEKRAERDLGVFAV